MKKDKGSSKFHEYFSLDKDYKQIEAMFTNKTKLAEFRRYVYNKAIQFFPELKQKEKDAKKLMHQQVEDLVCLIQEDDVFRSFTKLLTLSSEIGQVLGNKVLLKRNLEKKNCTKKKMRDIRDPETLYLRMTALNPTTIRFMVKNKKFPRLEIKLNNDHHLKQVEEYLKKKWIERTKQDCTELIIYPEPKGSQVIKEPLNKFLLMQDIFHAYPWQESNVMTFKYEIIQKPKQVNVDANNTANVITNTKAQNAAFVPIPPKVTPPDDEAEGYPKIILPQLIRPDALLHDHFKSLLSRPDFSFDDRYQNSIFAHNLNSFDFDRGGIHSFYNSLDFQYLYDHSHQFMKQTSNSKLDVLKQSIQKVEAEEVGEGNQFRQGNMNSNGSGGNVGNESITQPKVPKIKRKEGGKVKDQQADLPDNQ